MVEDALHLLAKSPDGQTLMDHPAIAKAVSVLAAHDRVDPVRADSGLIPPAQGALVRVINVRENREQMVVKEEQKVRLRAKDLSKEEEDLLLKMDQPQNLSYYF